MKHARILTCILLFALSCLLCVGIAAENGGFAPGSTDVFYVSNTSGADANEGTSAAAPLKTLGKAYSKMTKGGTLVICGEVTIPSAFTPVDAGGMVIFTSVYGGKDYRDSGARLNVGGNMGFANATGFERMNLRITVGGLVFSGRHHSLYFGSDLKVTNGTGSSDFTYPTLVGGYNNPSTLSDASSTADYTLCIRSGTWHSVFGGNRRGNSTSAFGKLSGDVTVRISGGTFNGTVSASGMNVHTGRLYLGTADTPVFKDTVCGYYRYGTMPAASLRTTAKYSGGVMVRLAGGTFKSGFRLGMSRVKELGANNLPQIYGAATVVVTGGTFSGKVDGGGTLGTTLLKYKQSVLDESKIVDFPVCRTGSLTYSDDKFEYSRFDTKLFEHKADPYVTQKDGVYYYCYSTYSAADDIWKICVAASGNVAIGDRTERARAVFNSNMTTIANAKYEYWAPELHYIEASDFGAEHAGWYIYFAADNDDNKNHRMYVLRATEHENPLSNYKMIGEVKTDDNRWAIDGTILRISSGSYKGMYFLWSGWPGTENVTQNIYIQKMKSPSVLTGNRVRLSSPDYSWEQGGSGCTKSGKYMPTINEGPQVLQNGKVTHVIYSASGSWSEHYCYGALTLKTGANPMDRDNWAKSSTAVFKSGNGMFGVGHGTFVKDAHGDWWMYYHGNNTSDIPEGATWWSQRSIYAKKFTFTTKTLFGASYAYPNFGSPASDTGEQFAYTRTTHYHASGDHQYSPLTLKTDGTYTKLVKSCCLCGAETVVKQVAKPTVKAVSNPEGGNKLTITPTVTGATGYKIFRCPTGGSYEQIPTTGLTTYNDAESTIYIDASAAVGITYTYKVQAYLEKAYNSTANGTMTSYSSDASGAVETVPAAVPITNIYYDGSLVYFRWDASSTAERYKIFRKLGGGSWESLGFTTETAYRDTTVSKGKTYSYAVQGWKKVNGKDVYGAITTVVQTIKTTQLPAPTLTVKLDENGLKLSASAVSGAYGYKFYRSTDGTNYKPLKATRETSYVDNTVETCTTYYYKVRAYTQSGVVFVYGVHSEAVSKGSPMPAVAIKSIAYSNGAVRFSWNAAGTVTKYKIFRKLSGETTWEILGYAEGTTSYADSTAVKGKTYVYAVQNCTKAGGVWYYSMISNVGKTITVPK